MRALVDFRHLLPFLRTERSSYLLGTALILLTSGFLVAMPWLVGQAVACLESGVRVDRAPLLALAMVGAVLLRGLTAFYMRRVTIGASRRIEFRFRNHLFRHIERQDAGFFASIHTGDLISRFTSDVDAVRAALGPGIMYSVSTVFTLAFALVVMLDISVPLTLYSLVPLVLLTYVLRSLGPRVHQASMRVQEHLSELSTHAQENFSHVKVLKSFGREHSEVARMQGHSQRYLEQNMDLARLRARTNALLFLIGDLVILCLLLLGGGELIRGSISLGEFAAFKGCQLLLIWPMIALGWVMMLFQRGAASARRLNTVLEARPAIDDRAANPTLVVTDGALELRQVTFRHAAAGPTTGFSAGPTTGFSAGPTTGPTTPPAPAPPVLDGVTLTLPAGATLGIVGPTGSGKTTLLQLIARLLPGAPGTLFVDGVPVERYPLAALRDAIGYVPQEPFLFSATIRENLAFGVEHASDAEIEEIARLVQLDSEIRAFPHGYEQRVGERGITLSGGQQQRVALARALLKRPRLLLLDDVLSAVDAHTETAILEGLRAWTKTLTTVIVSHRLSAVRHAELVIVLERGRITQRGTHAQLIAQVGSYAELHRKQTLEDELEKLA